MKDRLSLIETDKSREECGVFGIYLHPDLAHNGIVEMALGCALNNQHRGEESCGVCVSDGYSLWPPIKRMGLIKDLYADYKKEKKEHGGLYGQIAIVHNRYSTTGSSNIENAAPFRFDTNLGVMAVAHNGNITNASQLKAELFKKGVTFSSTTDSEVIGALISTSQGDTWREKISGALEKLEGSFSLIISTTDKLFAARDRHGVRPLSVGSFSADGKKCFAVSSETAALSPLQVEEIYDVAAGELLEINSEGVGHGRFAPKQESSLCGLEIAYLMRPDSSIRKTQMDTVRRFLGGKLAEICPPTSNVDLVTYIPESSRPAAEGYAQKLGLPTATSMIKGRYGTLNGSVRGFINPNEKERQGVARNYHVFDVVKGKDIVLTDDSIIRGNTTRGVIKVLREAGVGKIHLRIIFPPVVGYCPLGTDINEKDFLVAREFGSDISAIAKYIGVDSLGYLNPSQYSLAMSEVLGENVGLCLGCVTGKYPVGKFQIDKLIFEADIK
ncbi:MAG TPA: amidophosphoribosyltransferase [Patescibacteria group bacterium]